MVCTSYTTPSERDAKLLAGTLSTHFRACTGFSTIALLVIRTSSLPQDAAQHHWLENVSVSDRAPKPWPYMQIYVERVLRGDLPDPKTKSFEAVKNRV